MAKKRTDIVLERLQIMLEKLEKVEKQVSAIYERLIKPDKEETGMEDIYSLIRKDSRILIKIQHLRYTTKSNLYDLWDMTKKQAEPIVRILVRAGVLEKYRSYWKVNQKEIEKYLSIASEEEEFSDADAAAARIAKAELGIEDSDEEELEEFEKRMENKNGRKSK